MESMAYPQNCSQILQLLEMIVNCSQNSGELNGSRTSNPFNFQPFENVVNSCISDSSEMRVALSRVARTIDKSQDLSKQQQIISTSVRPISSSIASVDSRVKSWPVQQTGTDSTGHLTLESHLADYAILFTKFGEALVPQNSSEIYGKLFALREQIGISEAKFANLKKTKQKVGAAAVLQEGRHLQGLLAQQRQLERDLALTVVNEWTDAISVLVSGLNEVDKTPTIP
jgi:hypothetical protein